MSGAARAAPRCPSRCSPDRDRCPRWYVRRASSSSLLLQTNVRMHSTTIRRTERKRRARKRAFSTIPPTPDGCSSNARTIKRAPQATSAPTQEDARTRSLRFSDARIFPLSQAPSYGNRNRPSEQRQQRAGRRQVHGTVVARRSQTRDGRRDAARSCIFISSFRESSVSLSALGLAWTLPRALAGILKFRYQRSRILDLERVARAFAHKTAVFVPSVEDRLAKRLRFDGDGRPFRNARVAPGVALALCFDGHCQIIDVASAVLCVRLYRLP